MEGGLASAVMGSIWEGDRVRLRGIEPGDWEAVMRFDQWSEDVRSGGMLFQPRFPRDVHAQDRSDKGLGRGGTGVLLRWAHHARSDAFPLRKTKTANGTHARIAAAR